PCHHRARSISLGRSLTARTMPGSVEPLRQALEWEISSSDERGWLFDGYICGCVGNRTNGLYSVVDRGPPRRVGSSEQLGLGERDDGHLRSEGAAGRGIGCFASWPRLQRPLDGAILRIPDAYVVRNARGIGMVDRERQCAHRVALVDIALGGERERKGRGPCDSDRGHYAPDCAPAKGGVYEGALVLQQGVRRRESGARQEDQRVTQQVRRTEVPAKVAVLPNARASCVTRQAASQT